MLRGCLQTKVTTEWYLLFPTITSSGLRPTKRKHSETCRLRRQFNAWRRRRVLRRQRGAKSTFSPIAISTTTAYAITRPKQPTWRPPDSANTSVCSVGKFGTVTESEKIGHSSPEHVTGAGRKSSEHCGSGAVWGMKRPLRIRSKLWIDCSRDSPRDRRQFTTRIAIFFLNSGLIISPRHIDRRTCYELSSRRSEQSMINWTVVCQLSW